MISPVSSERRPVVWLHIGHGKTGTTALQTYFIERDRHDPAIFYPETGRMPPEHIIGFFRRAVART